MNPSRPKTSGGNHPASPDRFYVLRFTSHPPRLTALLLFVVALLPRLPGLGRFLTSDENTNIFFAGSDVIAAFLQGDLRGTYWHFYPGVTMSWLDALGMAGQYGLELLAGRSVPPFNEYIYGDILSLVIANRLPYAILTAAGVALLYLLARRLLPEPVALLGALCLAFDPFYLAHSRVAHGDAPVAVFMSLSALAFFIYGQQTLAAIKISLPIFPQEEEKPEIPPTGGPGGLQSLRQPMLLVSAICGSLAALTKAPGQFMALFIIGMAVIYGLLQIRLLSRQPTVVNRQPSSNTELHASRFTFYVLRITSHWLAVIAVWGLVSLAIFVLLWPSMWVDPVGTFRQMLDETFGKVNEGHLVYFFGQPTLDPGPWFYAYVIPFRLTPVIFTGTLLSLLAVIPGLRSFILQRNENSYISPLFLLWLFTLSLFLFGNLSPKKQDRYLLPLFPFLNLIAALGWLGFFNLVSHFLRSKVANANRAPHPSIRWRASGYGALLILLVWHILPTFTYYPYYLTYFNPLFGGPTRAAETTLMGWGEGMEQVAAYLNAKPNAAHLYVASTPSQTLLPYFVGTGENFYTNDIPLRADYVVLYLAQRQRLAPSPDIVRYFEAQEPEHIITIQGVPYAKIYPGPKFITTDIPPEATPANIGLGDKIRLAGFTLHRPTDHHLPITLYWHALAPLTTDYTISVRARAADGRWLAQRDSWSVDGLLPTTQWRQGDYVADTHTLELPSAETAHLRYIEIVVYEAETGQTLGPPITLPIEAANDEAR